MLNLCRNQAKEIRYTWVCSVIDFTFKIFIAICGHLMQYVVLFPKFFQLCLDEIEHGFVSTKLAVRSGKVVWITYCLNKAIKIFEKSIKEDDVACAYCCEVIPVLFDIFMNDSILSGIVVNVPPR